MRGTATHQQRRHEGNEPDVCKARHRRSDLDVIHAVLHQPVHDLDEDERCKHGDEEGAELLSEDGQCQEGLHDGGGQPLPDHLDFKISQCA